VDAVTESVERESFEELEGELALPWAARIVRSDMGVEDVRTISGRLLAWKSGSRSSSTVLAAAVVDGGEAAAWKVKTLAAEWGDTTVTVRGWVAVDAAVGLLPWPTGASSRPAPPLVEGSPVVSLRLRQSKCPPPDLGVTSSGKPIMGVVDWQGWLNAAASSRRSGLS
jgi:hypothetical protein